MAKFAKLFETTEMGQVLVTLDDTYEDGEGDTLWPVSIRGEDYKDCIIRVAPGYRTEADAQFFFDNIGEAEAMNAVRHGRAAVDAMLGEG